MSVYKSGIYMWLMWYHLDSIYCRGATGGGGHSGSSYTPYKAKRYGGYYSTRYFSYSAVGTARYSRVYRGTRNDFTYYYNYMLSWLGSESFKVYKKTPSEYISVCRNYEANANGTFLGVFTCPLPFEPSSHAYCCGYPNAQYCCRFRDLPCNMKAALICASMLFGILATLIYTIVTMLYHSSLHRPCNMIAAIICASMLFGILATLIYIVVKLCIHRAKIRAEKRDLLSNQSTGEHSRFRVNRRRSSPAALMSSGAANGSLKQFYLRNFGVWR